MSDRKLTQEWVLDNGKRWDKWDTREWVRKMAELVWWSPTGCYCNVCGRSIEMDDWGEWKHVRVDTSWRPHKAILEPKERTI